MISTAPTPIPSDRLEASDFLRACDDQPDSLIYFLLNVGDGDTQLILLPAEPGIRREAGGRWSWTSPPTTSSPS